MIHDSTQGSIGNTVFAGLVYFVGVFVLGFLLGSIRVILLEPRTGELIAVLVEMPIMLSLAWVYCARITSKLKISFYWSKRLLMGSVALTLLLSAEFAFYVIVFGNPPAGYITSFTTAPGAIGLCGQIVYAVFPLMQANKHSHGLSQ